MTGTTEKTWYDGNHNPVDAAAVLTPAEDEPTDWLPDAEGNEIREGDFVEILPGNSHGDWVGRIVRVTGTTRGRLYTQGSLWDGEKGVWSPDTPTNRIGIKWQNRVSTGSRPQHVRKVNLTAADSARLELAELLYLSARIDEDRAKLEDRRAAMNVRIRHAQHVVEEAERRG